MIFPYVSKIYGFNYAGELYGFVVLSTGISSMISASIYYIISHFSDNSDGTYLIIFLIGCILNVLAIILALFESNEPFSFDIINKNDNKENNLILSSKIKSNIKENEENDESVKKYEETIY